jgi:hypothetical protein
MNAAKDAILAVFPGARVTTNCVDEYPIRVTIEAEDPKDGNTFTVWRGDQRELFRKNNHVAVPKIKSAVGVLKARKSPQPK